jgi:hypothetical protein
MEGILVNALQERITKLFNLNTPLRKISSEVGVPTTSLCRLIEKYELVRFPITRKKVLNFDDKVFDSINEDSVYWLGFIQADGCIFHYQTGYPGGYCRDDRHI